MLHRGRYAPVAPGETRGREPGEEDPEQVLRRRLGLSRAFHLWALGHFVWPPGGATKSRRATACCQGNRAGQNGGDIVGNTGAVRERGRFRCDSASTDGGNPEHGRFGCIIAHAETASCDQSRSGRRGAVTNCGKTPEADSSRPNLSDSSGSGPCEIIRRFSGRFVGHFSRGFTGRFSRDVGNRGGPSIRGGQSLDLGG